MTATLRPLKYETVFATSAVDNIVLSPAPAAAGTVFKVMHAVQVKDTMTKFEERLWSLIRNFVELGHNNPAMLVAAVRIVEIQELVDKQLESSGRGKQSAPLPVMHRQLHRHALW